MYEASSIASELGITPRQQIMAMGGFSLYRGGKAVLKNPMVKSAINNSADIAKATVKDAILADSGMVVLNAGIGVQGKQLYNSFKKVTAERKALREGIASGESSISKVPENINSIKLNGINTGENAIKRNNFIGKLKGENITLEGIELRDVTYVKRNREDCKTLRSSFNSKERKRFLMELAKNPYKLKISGLNDEEILDIKDGYVPDGWQVHHKLPLDDSGDNSFQNLILIKNDPYHKVITNYQKTITKGIVVGESRNIKFPVPEGEIYPRHKK